MIIHKDIDQASRSTAFGTRNGGVRDIHGLVFVGFSSERHFFLSQAMRTRLLCGGEKGERLVLRAYPGYFQ